MKRELLRSWVDPYFALARIYDDLMSYVDYQSWVEFIISIMTDYGMPFPSETDNPRVLECACGTGNFAARMAIFGYKVDAFDRSGEMIKIANLKTSTLRNRPKFYVANLSDFGVTAKKSVVLCLYDSINYLVKFSDVANYLSRVKRILNPGGVLIFDICTETNSLLYFSNHKEKGEGEGYRYQREMYYHPGSKIQENIFNIIFDDNPDTILRERHQQRIYSLREIRKIIKKSGLEIYEETDDFQRQPPHRKTRRIHFVCKNRESETRYQP